MNFQRSGRKNKKKMGSYDLEAVNQPLEEAASQLSLDSLQDHKTHLTLGIFQEWDAFVKNLFALQPTVSGKLMTYQLLLSVQPTEDIICNIMTIRKFYCSSTLICPIRKTYRWIFWNAGNRQAIDGYDDSECNSRILREGSYWFSLDPGKHTLCTWWRKLISVRTFSWTFKVDNFTCSKAKH